MLLGASVPSESEKPVEPPQAGASLAQEREVGDEREVEVHDASREVEGDRGDVPDQGREKLRMEQRHVDELGAAEVEEDVDGSHHQRDHRDDLGDPGDGPSPLGPVSRRIAEMSVPAWLIPMKKM